MNAVVDFQRSNTDKYTRNLGFGSGILFTTIFDGELDGPKYLNALKCLRSEMESGLTLKNDASPKLLVRELSTEVKGDAVLEVLTAILQYAFGTDSAHQYLRELVQEELTGSHNVEYLSPTVCFAPLPQITKEKE